MGVSALVLLASVSVTGDSQLLVFGSTWCEPCRQMQPVVAQLVAAGYPVRKIDVDRESELAARFRVSAVPAFVLVKNGRVVDRIDGATSVDRLQGMFRQRGGLAPTVRAQSPTSRLGQLSSAVIGAIAPPRPANTAGDVPPPTAVLPASASPTTSSSPADAALAATVRLVVEDATGHSYGTGTVIDVHGSDALVVTCGHIFRESQGSGGIKVERFDRGAAEAMVGSLISFDDELDVALLSVRLTHPLRPVLLAGQDARPKPGEPIFSIGCNHGQPPTVVTGKINAVNKYLGPENVTASGRPVDGRSGGGLFNQQGELIGVCNAADPELDEGLYAGLARVRSQLDQNNLAFVYQRALNSPAVAPPQPSTSTTGLPVSLVNHETVATKQRGVANADSNRRPSATTADVKDELVCVVRSGRDNGQSRVFVVTDPSPDLIRQLTTEANRGQ